MKHIFIIKDFLATEESAKHIMNSQINVILGAAEDIDIKEIKVFVNDFNVDHYTNYVNSIPVEFVPTLKKGKKNKQVSKQTFAAFYNSIINSISSDLSSLDTIVHIQDGTLDLTDIPSERGFQKSRLGEMIHDVVEMMKLIDHPVWFNTASDKGNMKFEHYYTMLDFINVDKSCLFESLPNCMMYAGNSNLDWIIVDVEEYKNKKMPSLMMNSSYDYDFLSIKELIAKFVDVENGYYDNLFPTVPTEVGAYFRNKEFDRDLQQYDMSKYKENIEKYKENLKEYKKLASTKITDAIQFVREKFLSKLSDEDKKTLNEFETTGM